MSATRQLGKRTAASQSMEEDDTAGATQASMSATQAPFSQVNFHQPQQERLATRRRYRNLRDDVLENRQDLLEPTAANRERLMQALAEADRHFESVKMPREGALDASFLSMTTKMLVEQAERMASGIKSYDPTVFVTRIKGMLGSKEGITELGQIAKSYSLGVETRTFMLGPMAVEVKARKERQRKPKDVVEESTRPDDVDDTEADEKNESTKRVEVLSSYLNDEGELDYWRFVLDTDEEKGFGRTIENIFYASFLVRDGLAGIDVRGTDREPVPWIRAAEAPADSDYADDNIKKHQCIIQLSYSYWLKLCRIYEGQPTFLPPPTATALPPPPVAATSKPKKRTSSLNGVIPNGTQGKKKTQSSASMDDVFDDEVPNGKAQQSSKAANGKTRRTRTSAPADEEDYEEATQKPTYHDDEDLQELSQIPASRNRRNRNIPANNEEEEEVDYSQTNGHKKRNRASMSSAEGDDLEEEASQVVPRKKRVYQLDDDDIAEMSQVAATPEEEMPRSKRSRS